jgi:hypothetical protein
MGAGAGTAGGTLGTGAVSGVPAMGLTAGESCGFFERGLAELPLAGMSGVGNCVVGSTEGWMGAGVAGAVCDTSGLGATEIVGVKGAAA